MIKSIKFPKEGKGYIYTKPENPGKAPDKKDFRYRDYNIDTHEPEFNRKKYDRDYKEWKADKKFYDENKGKFINPAAPVLIGKTFNFEPGKLNIIFGPNGCGKTTILKAIAGNAGIDGDGITKAADPSDAFGFFNKPTVEMVAKHIEELKQNSCEVEWDGNVVYYDNFAKTLKRGYGFIGGINGTALAGYGDEITYRINEDKTNAGKKAMWLLGNVLEYQKKGITLEKIFEPHLKNKRNNDTWANSYKIQAEYFKRYENYDKEVPMTMLLDEPEVNFDITTVYNLYTKAFPTICKESGMQFITVSHSPIVMCDEILNNEYINLVSLDDNYTSQVKDLLRTMQF